MRAVVQRVSRAAVTVAGKPLCSCEHGLLVLLCAMQGDRTAEAKRMAAKIARLRIFADERGKLNKSVLDKSGRCLVVSQFTLSADCSGGNRPSFTAAAAGPNAAQLCDVVAAELTKLGVAVETGRFGADMQVELVNDGPVTIWLDSADW